MKVHPVIALAYDMEPKIAELLASKASRPHALYHYTSTHSAHAIIESSSLSMFNVLTSNDEQELKDAINLVAERIEERRDQLKMPAKALSVFTHEVSGWADFLEFYAVSFAGREEEFYGNDLEMWRGYGDDGNGCALIFKTETMPGIAKKCDSLLLPVFYDRDTKLDILDEALGLVCATYNKGKDLGFDEDDLEQRFVTNLAASFQALVCSFKSHFFSLEREWRLVRLCGTEEITRAFDDRNRPFITAPFGPNDDVLDGALVGPSPHQLSNAVSLKSRFRSAKFSPAVITSSIPYRPRRS